MTPLEAEIAEAAEAYAWLGKNIDPDKYENFLAGAKWGYERGKEDMPIGDRLFKLERELSEASAEIEKLRPYYVASVAETIKIKAFNEKCAELATATQLIEQMAEALKLVVTWEGRPTNPPRLVGAAAGALSAYQEYKKARGDGL